MTTKPDIETKSVVRNSNFSLLRVPSVAWFLSGTALTYAAQWIQNVTLSWMVYDLTSSGALLGTLSLVRSIAAAGLMPIAGVIIDRIRRRRLLIATSAWLLIISLAFGLIISGKPTLIWPLFLFSFLGGIGQAFSMPLRQTVVFSIVPRSQAVNVLALNQTGWALMRSIGPAIGGFLILWIGPAGNFFVQAAAYALVIYTVIHLQLPYENPDVIRANSSGSFREGWAYIKSNLTTRSFLLMSLMLPLLIIPNINTLTPIYAKDIFVGGPDTLGMLLSAIGAGGIVGGFVTSSLRELDRRGVLLLVSVFLLSLSLIAFSLSTSLWMALVFLALAGFFEVIFLTTNTTLMQLSIPDSLRGRVTGIASLWSGLTPVGAFIAGIGSDLVGPRMITTVSGGILGLLAVVIFVFSPTIREYRLSQTITDKDDPSSP